MTLLSVFEQKLSLRGHSVSFIAATCIINGKLFWLGKNKDNKVLGVFVERMGREKLKKKKKNHIFAFHYVILDGLN